MVRWRTAYKIDEFTRTVDRHHNPRTSSPRTSDHRANLRGHRRWPHRPFAPKNRAAAIMTTSNGSAGFRFPRLVMVERRYSDFRSVTSEMVVCLCGGTAIEMRRFNDWPWKITIKVYDYKHKMVPTAWLKYKPSHFQIKHSVSPVGITAKCGGLTFDLQKLPQR